VVCTLLDTPGDDRRQIIEYQKAHPSGPADAHRSSRPFSYLLRTPLFVLGVGVYRAWIEIMWVTPATDLPSWAVAGHNAFDEAMVVTLLLAAVFSRRLVPLHRKRAAVWGSAALMSAGTIAAFTSVHVPQLAEVLAYPASIAAGVGTGLLILLWSEFYGCLNTTRVAIYYSLSILLGAALVFVMRGFMPGHLAFFSTVLPIVSGVFVVRSFAAVPSEDLPAPTWGRFSFPWKPVALMAVYAFAFGLRESAMYSETGPHSSWGVIFVALLVVAGVMVGTDRFDLALIYRVGLPLMVGGLLLVPLISPSGSLISNFCVSASYTAFSILIMLILANIVHNYGVGAVWLFGIERGLRAVVMLGGRTTTSLLTASGLSTGLQNTIVTMSVLLLLVVCTMILLSEKDLTSRWGVTLLDGEVDSPTRERNRLAGVTASLAEKYQLTPREIEVLQLLAERKCMAEVQSELYISQGTAKAHIAHIYRKVDIHTRAELLDLLGVEDGVNCTDEG